MAPPGNQAETENTNIDLQRRKKLIYSTQMPITMPTYWIDGAFSETDPVVV